ncbi:hypothetical protein P153DRAFT_381626 [Dothidotthia symphoricarpi CBS 119687]|uniref:RRM domain-containing protein n=1 Tax=Dothidotthia symphoricarpi CBS 119687 TaxID=1392245 RepID=A0A6A6ANS3_9PLEO|nr:uncharacterized protein P153DRAFT_381626 [Dothidotthia symphoricarpi CBS 119687]KAF2133186.1 hypothetical protein P153DRAFT_381626 [Dothidotthia symphoricarpi CBS 119687]
MITRRPHAAGVYKSILQAVEEIAGGGGQIWGNRVRDGASPSSIDHRSSALRQPSTLSNVLLKQVAKSVCLFPYTRHGHCNHRQNLLRGSLTKVGTLDLFSCTMRPKVFAYQPDRAEFHSSGREFELGPSLSDIVTVSKAEHEYLLQATREYNLLRNALFRGGLTTETLETLLAGENGATNDEPPQYDYSSEKAYARPNHVPVIMSTPHYHDTSPVSDNTAARHDLQPRNQPCPDHRSHSYGLPESSDDTFLRDDEDHEQERKQRGVPVHDQRTVLITNLSERTTHKDLASIVRGGRLLDIFLRNDRSATVSFVEGATEFMAYAKRNDIYLHMKRLMFSWNERQFHVPQHVSNKIANGASRNLVVRGVAEKLTADEIRDHLDHIHNLVVVDIYFKNGDAYISTNSIHNALFARTCMMSRTVYKGIRIDWYPDECAAPLPRPSSKPRTPAMAASMKPMPVANPYALLDTGSDTDSDSDEDESYGRNGVRVDGHNWADAIVA